MNDLTDVYIFDDMNPEDGAMAQSLYSRSPASILDHRKKIEESGSGKFMGSFYVGYGHASIGDCGSTTSFQEQVSMIAAKSIQDNQLYSGQEASTRYLDFSKQPMIDPYGHPITRAIQARWMDLYNIFKPLVVTGLKRLHPYDPDSGDSVAKWEKAINTRAFDTVRSLLPLGTTTNLSWHSNLRQMREHLNYMYTHPAQEVQELAAKLYAKCVEKYPNSFNMEISEQMSTGEQYDTADGRYAERNAYASEHALDNHYLTPTAFLDGVGEKQIDSIFGGELVALLPSNPKINKDPARLNRPRGAKLPKRFKSYGQVDMKFLIDFGSWRDLQRHRDGFCPVPLVDDTFGFFSGYEVEFERVLDQADFVTLMEAINEQLFKIDNLVEHGIQPNSIKSQYLYPMGMAVGCQLNYTIPQVLYVAELRSQKTVHFTLRPFAQTMGNVLKELCPDLNTYVDMDGDSFVTKRADQDIVAKEPASL